MRTVIVIDPSRVDGHLYAVPCQKAPEAGEFVELVAADRVTVFKVGKVANIRADKSWPDHYLYDVVVNPTDLIGRITGEQR